MQPRSVRTQLRLRLHAIRYIVSFVEVFGNHEFEPAFFLLLVNRIITGGGRLLKGRSLDHKLFLSYKCSVLSAIRKFIFRPQFKKFMLPIAEDFRKRICNPIIFNTQCSTPARLMGTWTKYGAQSLAAPSHQPHSNRILTALTHIQIGTCTA